MAIWNRPDRKEINSNELKKSDIVFSNFSAAQASENQFILVGTLHFNPGKIVFDEGFGEFALKQARVSVLGKGCACDYNSIAYIARSSETQDINVQSKNTVSKDKASQISAEGQAGGSLLKGVSAQASIKGNLKGAFDEQSTQTSNREAEGIRSLIMAYPRKRKEGLVEQVDWDIFADPLIPLETANGTYAVLVGERMHAANDGAGLAVVSIEEPDGFLEISLEITSGNIQWTNIEFSDHSPLHQFGKRIVDGKEKRDILGRIALSKAIAGSFTLQKISAVNNNA